LQNFGRVEHDLMELIVVSICTFC